MKRKYILALAVVATAMLSSCNEDIDEIVLSDENGKDKQIENFLFKERVVMRKFFDGYIMYHDKSLHRATGIFEATFEDGKLVDLKFYGMIDGVDGTYGFLIKGNSNNSFDIFIEQDGKEQQVIKDDILKLFEEEIKI